MFFVHTRCITVERITPAAAEEELREKSIPWKAMQHQQSVLGRQIRLRRQVLGLKPELVHGFLKTLGLVAFGTMDPIETMIAEGPATKPKTKQQSVTQKQARVVEELSLSTKIPGKSFSMSTGASALMEEESASIEKFTPRPCPYSASFKAQRP